MKLIILSFSFLFIFSSSLLAQEKKTITVQGSLFDKSTGEPLPYANISLINNRMGTVSNGMGKFKMIIPAIYQNDSLRISYLGFEPILEKISEIPSDVKFFLIEDPQMLEEIEVVGLTVSTILQKAIQKIPENYHHTPYKSHGFYRVTSQKDKHYIHLSEAVFEILHANDASHKNDFKLTKMRAIKDERASHGLDLGLTAKAIFNFDMANNPNVFDLLNKKGLKNHDFKLEGTFDYQGREVYVLSFDQKPELKKAGYQGALYIDTETFAFLYLDFGLSQKGIGYKKFGDASQRILMELLDIHIGMQRDDYQISYKKIGDKYYLSSVGNDATLSFRSSRDHYDFLVDTRVDYLVSRIDPGSQESFSKEDILGKGKLIETQDSPYDPAFWEHYNIILPSTDFVAIAKKIEASNQANDVKQELADRLRKFPKDKAIRIDSILSFYNEKDLFNGNALITYEGEVLLQKSYNNTLTQNRNNTQFRIGSTSKTFTSMLILMLEQEGQLSVSDSIGRFLPDYPYGDISLEQLLTHQSGIPDYLSNRDHLVKLLAKAYPLEEVAHQFCADSLEFEPGSQFKYSNSGYVLLACVIERATGKPFRMALEERIFRPLQMDQSYFGQAKDTTQLATGFLYGYPEPPYFKQNVGGAGGITSTSTDLLKWSEAIDLGKLLPAEKQNALFVPRAVYSDWDAGYGYGWMIDQFLFRASKKHKIFYHPGTDFGFYTMFLKQPDKKITIILLNNTGDFPRFEMTDLILNEVN